MNFWILKESKKYSWAINRLLRLRDKAFPWIKNRVGNGMTCRYLSDNWSHYGNLAVFLELGNTRRLGIPWLATISELFHNGQWSLPPVRSDNQVLLYAYLSTLTLTEEEDEVEWVVNDKCLKSYSTGQIYKELKHHNTQVSWNKLVWISWGIPKHSFLTWLFVKDRCPTRDRIINWGLQTQPNCLLCNAPAESRNHIYFECPYTWSIWSMKSSR